jgi:hypothetical protein
VYGQAAGTQTEFFQHTIERNILKAAMISCSDDVLISKIQDAVKEIEADIHLANNFIPEAAKGIENNDERR